MDFTFSGLPDSSKRTEARILRTSAILSIVSGDGKRSQASMLPIVIYGYINQVRKSILDEYIVELSVNVDWAVFNISVVYPKKISPAMKEELMYLKRGDYFQALVFTRSTYAYVDVPVWNSNGTYRTEP